MICTLLELIIKTLFKQNGLAYRGSYLIVRIPEIVDGPGLPEFSQSQKSTWPESVFSHDHKVSEESGRSLNQTELKHKLKEVNNEIHQTKNSAI